MFSLNWQVEENTVHHIRIITNNMPSMGLGCIAETIQLNKG